METDEKLRKLEIEAEKKRLWELEREKEKEKLEQERLERKERDRKVCILFFSITDKVVTQLQLHDLVMRLELNCIKMFLRLRRKYLSDRDWRKRSE